MKNIFLLIGIILLISPISALLITTENITASSITWSWDASPIANISINGVYVCDLDPNSHKLTLSDLQEEEYHTIIVYENNTSNASTTTQTNKATTSRIIDFTYAYLIFIVAILCILAGLKIPILAWAGCGFAIMGIVTTVFVTFWVGLIFMVVFCAGVLVAFSNSGD